MVSERSESLNEQKQGQEKQRQRAFIIEELKNKVNHETAKDEKPDSEINDLLSALGDESNDKSQPEPNNAQPAETEQSRTEKAEPQNLNAKSKDESEKKTR